MMTKESTPSSQEAQEAVADQKASISFDSHGLVTPESLEACRERSKKWRPAVVTMGKRVHDSIMSYKPDPETGLRPVCFLMFGSLLGAYRSGKMVEHDYDFDFGLCFFFEDSGKMANCEQSREELVKLHQHMIETLDESYTILLHNDYSCKLEVVQKSSGIHFYRYEPWYNVVTDIQIFYTNDQNKFEIAYFAEEYYEYFDASISTFF
ncbi:MAG: hypothetical protein AAF639_11295, partial [Chloroflexota bacterium]